MQSFYNLTGYVRLTVTNKTYVPPSGDKADYVSNGPYWYPREKAPCLNDPVGQMEREKYVAVCAPASEKLLAFFVAAPVRARGRFCCVSTVANVGLSLLPRLS
jgi:hypothetical protein